MTRNNRPAGGPIIHFSVALVALLAIGMSFAGSATAKSWFTGGKEFTGEEPFVSSGLLKIEIPSKFATFNCTETGTGKIFASTNVEGEMTLTCTLAGNEKCIFSAVKRKYGGNGGAFALNPPSLLLISNGGACSWYEETLIKETTQFGEEFGPEAVTQSFTFSADGTFGANPVFFSYSSNWELAKKTKWGTGGPAHVAFAFGSSGSEGGKFNGNEGIAIDHEGNVWIVDKNNNRLEKFNYNGEFVSSFGSFGTGKGQFNHPTDIAINPKTWDLMVTDTGNNRIERFNSSGSYVGEFGKAGTGFGEFKAPEGITVDADGYTWVVDTGNNRVQKVNYKGEYLGSFGSTGKGNGLFRHPTDVVVDSEQYIWVTDTENNRVEKFEYEGGYESKFGIEGVGNGQFKGPRGIAIDADGNIWIVDRGNHRVQELSSGGAYVSQLGEEGTGSGQFGNTMSYLAFDPNDNPWIGDGGNARVQKWWR
jgi:DNA-binding beta-propeller fold protein YncE